MLAQWSLEEHSSLPQQTRTLEVQKNLLESENAVVCVGISAVNAFPLWAARVHGQLTLLSTPLTLLILYLGSSPSGSQWLFQNPE